MTPYEKYTSEPPQIMFFSVWRPSEKFLKLFVSNDFFFVCGKRAEEKKEGGIFITQKFCDN